MSDWADQELMALGKIVMNFAALEAIAEMLIGGFVGQRIVADTMSAGENMSWKLDKLAVLADRRLTDAGVREKLLDWVKDARLMTDRPA